MRTGRGRPGRAGRAPRRARPVTAGRSEAGWASTADAPVPGRDDVRRSLDPRDAPAQDGSGIDRCRERPEDGVDPAVEPAGAEGVGHRPGGEADEQGGPEDEGHPLDQVAGPALDGLGGGELGAQRGDGRVEARVGLRRQGRSPPSRRRPPRARAAWPAARRGR